MPVISRDEIKEGYVNSHGVKHDRLPPDTNSVVSDLIFEIVNRYLAAKVSVVIEAGFQHRVWCIMCANDEIMLSHIFHKGDERLENCNIHFAQYNREIGCNPLDEWVRDRCNFAA